MHEHNHLPGQQYELPFDREPAIAENTSERGWDYDILDEEDIACLDKDHDDQANWHQYLLVKWHSLPDFLDLRTIEQCISYVVDRYRAQRHLPLNRWQVKEHVLRALTLDLICASFPVGRPPSEELVELVRLALELPEKHEVGQWTQHGGRDSRGGADLGIRTTAMMIDHEYRCAHEKLMPLRELVRRVQEHLHLPAPPDRKSLRKWREEQDYKTFLQRPSWPV